MYFQNLPKIGYTFTNGSTFEQVTDIFFRTKFREIIKNENVAYYLYTVRDVDSPEGVAFKYYGDPQAYWVIFYANDIIDPYHDWPLNTKAFNNFIIDKYGSIENARTTVHHYEKHVKTRDSATDKWTTRIYVIDEEDARLLESQGVPHESYEELAVDYYPNIPGKFKNGQSVEMIISRNNVTNYDWEYENNEAKRNIKLIRKDFYPRIQREFEEITGTKTPMFRDLRGF